MTPTPNSAVVRAFYDAINGRDAAAVGGTIEAAFAPDATLILPPSLPYGGTFTGAAKLGRMFAGMVGSSALVGAQRIDVTDVIDGGDRVAAQLEFDWYPPGGSVPVHGGALELWTFADGRVTEIRAYYWDTAELAAATHHPDKESA